MFPKLIQDKRDINKLSRENMKALQEYYAEHYGYLRKEIINENGARIISFVKVK